MGLKGVICKIDMKQLEDKHANIGMDLVLEFKNQIKFESYTEEYECDKRKLSDYNLQQFWNFLQRKKCFKL